MLPQLPYIIQAFPHRGPWNSDLSFLNITFSLLYYFTFFKTIYYYKA